MKKFFCVTFLFLAALIAPARLFAGGLNPGYNWSAPVVPEEIVAQGRQEITSYLTKLVTYAEIEFEGKSVLQGTESRLFLDREALRERGYIDDGSFAQLSQAISGIFSQFAALKLPGGGLDVTAHVTFGSGNMRLYEGKASFMYTRGGDGILDGWARVYVSIPDHINMKVLGYVQYASWVEKGPEGPTQLVTQRFAGDESTYISLETRMIGNGVIGYVFPKGTVAAVDFEKKKIVYGENAVHTIGEVLSNDVVRYVPSGDKQSLSSFCAGLTTFQRRSDGNVYGRYPLIDFSTTTRIDETLDFGVKVWDIWTGDTSTQAIPTNIRVRVIRTLDGSISPGDYKPILMRGGGWLIQLPPGVYQIFMDFDDVQEWSMIVGPQA